MSTMSLYVSLILCQVGVDEDKSHRKCKRCNAGVSISRQTCWFRPLQTVELLTPIGAKMNKATCTEPSVVEVMNYKLG